MNKATLFPSGLVVVLLESSVQLLMECVEIG